MALAKQLLGQLESRVERLSELIDSQNLAQNSVDIAGAKKCLSQAQAWSQKGRPAEMTESSRAGLKCLSTR